MDEKERCDVELDAGVRCVLPMNHAGDVHEYNAVLPPDIAQYIAGHIDQLETARAYHQKEAKRARISAWVSLALIAIYLVLNIQEFIGLFT